MPLYDISLPLTPHLPVWPGDPAIEVASIARMEEGAVANVSRLSGTVHIGTHIDAPRHFIPDGATVEELPPELFIGRALVVDLTGVDAITAEALDAIRIPPRTRRVLFKTRNSALWAAGERAFREDYVAVTPDGAEWLVRASITEFEPDCKGGSAILVSAKQACIGLNLRIIDVATGRVLNATTVEATSASNRVGLVFATGGLPLGLGAYAKTPMEAAIRNAIETAVQHIAATKM